MDTMDQPSLRQRKIKLIIIAIAAAFVILVVGIWAISLALGNDTQPELESSDSTKVENKSENNEKVGSESTSPANNYQPTTVSSNNTTNNLRDNAVSAPVVNNMPSTGPTETVFSALMLGVVAYLVTLNLKITKENRNK